MVDYNYDDLSYSERIGIIEDYYFYYEFGDVIRDAKKMFSDEDKVWDYLDGYIDDIVYGNFSKPLHSCIKDKYDKEMLFWDLRRYVKGKYL